MDINLDDIQLEQESLSTISTFDHDFGSVSLEGVDFQNMYLTQSTFTNTITGPLKKPPLYIYDNFISINYCVTSNMWNELFILGPNVNLEEVDLRGMDMSDLNLSGVNFKNCTSGHLLKDSNPPSILPDGYVCKYNTENYPILLGPKLFYEDVDFSGIKINSIKLNNCRFINCNESVIEMTLTDNELPRNYSIIKQDNPTVNTDGSGVSIRSFKNNHKMNIYKKRYKKPSNRNAYHSFVHEKNQNQHQKSDLQYTIIDENITLDAIAHNLNIDNENLRMKRSTNDARYIALKSSLYNGYKDEVYIQTDNDNRNVFYNNYKEFISLENDITSETLAKDYTIRSKIILIQEIFSYLDSSSKLIYYQSRLDINHPYYDSSYDEEIFESYWRIYTKYEDTIFASETKNMVQLKTLFNENADISGNFVNFENITGSEMKVYTLEQTPMDKAYHLFVKLPDLASYEFYFTYKHQPCIHYNNIYKYIFVSPNELQLNSLNSNNVIIEHSTINKENDSFSDATLEHIKSTSKFNISEDDKYQDINGHKFGKYINFSGETISPSVSTEYQGNDSKTLKFCNFTDASFNNITFKDVKFTYATFDNTKFINCSFNQCELGPLDIHFKFIKPSHHINYPKFESITGTVTNILDIPYIFISRYHAWVLMNNSVYDKFQLVAEDMIAEKNEIHNNKTYEHDLSTIYTNINNNTDYRDLSSDAVSGFRNTIINTIETLNENIYFVNKEDTKLDNDLDEIIKKLTLSNEAGENDINSNVLELTKIFMEYIEMK